MAEHYPVKSIHGHAVNRYMQRVDSNRGAARVALTHMWAIGTNATDYQLRMMHRTRQAGRIYRISECCFGKYLLIMRTENNQIRTLWQISQ